MLFDTAPTDALTLASVALLFLIVGLLALLCPGLGAPPSSIPFQLYGRNSNYFKQCAEA